jgi:enamine deaminase RidA (YjgF/YER057c/UK114 family)
LPQYVNPDGVSAPVGLYSHVAIDDRSGLVFVAGQLAVRERLDEDVPADLGGQLEIVLENLTAVLESFGGLDRVLQMTTYLVSEDLIGEFYESRARLFPHFFGEPPYPPNTLLVVSRLVSPRHLVEIQAIASRA